MKANQEARSQEPEYFVRQGGGQVNHQGSKTPRLAVSGGGLAGAGPVKAESRLVKPGQGQSSDLEKNYFSGSTRAPEKLKMQKEAALRELAPINAKGGHGKLAAISEIRVKNQRYQVAFAPLR